MLRTRARINEEGGDHQVPALLTSVRTVHSFAAGPARRRDRHVEGPAGGLDAEAAPRAARPASRPGAEVVGSPSVVRRVLRLGLLSLRWASIGLVALVVGATLLGAALGYRAMAVTSGSMSPSINVRDAVVVSDSGGDGVEVGDVITYHAFGTTGMTTHRVMAIKQIKGATYFQTKGDANDTPDVNLAAADATLGRVVFRLPGMAEAILVASSPRGKVVLLGIPVLSLFVEEVLRILRMLKRREPKPFAPDPVAADLPAISA